MGDGEDDRRIEIGISTNLEVEVDQLIISINPLPDRQTSLDSIVQDWT